MKTFKFANCKVVALGLVLACALAAQMPNGMRGPFRGYGMGLGPDLPALVNRVVTGAPFSATETTATNRTLANGNQIQRQEQAKVSRDSQGRVRIDATLTVPDATGGQTTRTLTTISDPVAGYVYRLNPQTMTAVQTPRPTGTPRPASGSGSGAAGVRPNGAQAQTKDLGTQTINGVLATGTEVTTTVPAGAIGNTQPIQSVRVTWISTALQVPVQVTFNDPRTGTTAMNLTNIVQAEPDASLFRVPSGYTVTSGPGRPRSHEPFPPLSHR